MIFTPEGGRKWVNTEIVLAMPYAVCRRPRDSIAGDLRVHTAIRVPTKLDQMQSRSTVSGLSHVIHCHTQAGLQDYILKQVTDSEFQIVNIVVKISFSDINVDR